MINYVDAVLLSGKYWCVADSCTLWHSILAERELGCVKQLENCVAREARGCFCNSSQTGWVCTSGHCGSAGEAGRQEREPLWLPACTAGASHLEDLKPHCNSVQGLCLETVFKQRETKKKRHLLLRAYKESSNHLLFLFVLEFNACCLSSSSVFRSFCSYQK